MIYIRWPNMITTLSILYKNTNFWVILFKFTRKNIYAL